MKLKIQKDELEKALSKIQGIYAKTPLKPILSDILLDAGNDKLKMTATDLELSMKVSAEAEVINGGSIVIPGKKFMEIVRELPKAELDIEARENELLNISWEDGYFSLAGLGKEEFPEFPEDNLNESFEIAGNSLKDLIERTLFACSQDETRIYLTGIFTELIEEEQSYKLRMIATDGHRLSLDETSSEQNGIKSLKEGLIIPRKGGQEILKFINGQEKVNVKADKNQMVFICNDDVLHIRLLAGEFPNYKPIISTEFEQELKVEKEKILKTLKRMALMSSQQQSNRVDLKLSKELVEVSASDDILGNSRENIQVEYDGNEIKIALNARYLIEGINAVSGDKVIISFIDGDSVVRISDSGDKDFLYIVMPMQCAER